MNRPRPKIRVVVHIPELDEDRDTEPPGYSGHNGGRFDEAGYASGRGQFGSRHDTLS